MKVSYLILDFYRKEEGEILLKSLQKYTTHDKEIVYMINGGDYDYAYEFYRQGLIDTLIIKRNGDGGGFGQTDLWRYCKTKYAFFLQVDHELVCGISNDVIKYLINTLETYKFQCVDLSGNQGRGGWSDRAHFMSTEFFNSLGPFPNFGPGLDDGKWNEQHLQEVFRDHGYKIASIFPTFFKDLGKWSVRQAGDGLYKHRCDNKKMWILKQPTYKTEVYPPFDDEEWDRVLKGQWQDGDIPQQWKQHSFKCWD